MGNDSRYIYYQGLIQASHSNSQKTEAAVQMGRERNQPKLSNPDYLVLRERRRLLAGWVQRLSGDSLMVLDVGGRIQPYRPLLAGRLKMYVAVDLQATGLLDVIAAGEQLPFAGARFDLVICTQTLGYVSNPFGVVGEIRRVLKHGGVLLLSVPALFPCHHDERWRFLPDGLQVLLADFSHVEVEPEGHSFAGVMRTINVCLNIFIKRRIFRRVASGAVMPLINLAGIMLDRFSRGNDQFTTNYSALAIK